VILASSAENMVMQRRPQDALEFYEKLIELDQYFPRIYFGLARTYLILGRHKDAIDAVERGAALSRRSAMPLALRAHIYSSLGRIDEARAAIVELQEMSRTTRVAPYLFMRAWSVLDPERACDYLEKACEERDPRMVHAAVSPVFDCLRDRPRFDAVLRRMGLLTDHSTVTLTGCSR
jgi:tetratricopeptide (TPR) repeat protein